MKPGTYSQIYIQVVFAVKYRECLISTEWEDNLYKYITGIIQNKGHKMLAINGMPDHIHILFNMKPICHLSELVREIKKSSNKFINEEGYSRNPFQWQEGFGAFSYGYSQIPRITKYIENQKEHHRKNSFRKEYTHELNNHMIKYNSEFLFRWF